MRAFLVAALLLVAVSAYDVSYWNKLERANPSDAHSLVIAVKLKDGAEASCDTLLKKVSYPDSPDYGKWYKFEDMKVFSSERNFRLTKKWLIKSGITSDEITALPNKDFIRVHTTIEKAEKLLGVEYFKWEAKEDSSVVITRAESFQLPRRAAHIVDFVSPVARFPPPPSALIGQFQEKSKSRQNGGDVTPGLLSSFYNIGNSKVADPKSTQAVFEALGQNFSPSDLTAFQQKYNIPTIPIAKTLGPNSPSSCQTNPNSCGEANLDVQWILAVAQQATTWYWAIPGQGDIFVEWVTQVAGNSAAPYVHSISYGSLAKEDPQTDMKRFNTEVCKLGARGLTVLVATGDDGVANFAARNDPSQCGFDPSFPATSPYVTAVGATQGPEANGPEVACTSKTGGLITTGGGFSNIFSRPEWQDSVVTSYLNNGPNMPPKSMFNDKGRAYPDVAVMGHNYGIYIGGNEYVGSGTSASTPVFAAMITLINGQRFAAGKGPVGYINPTLYSLAGSPAFHDITSGENNCCAGSPTTATCCQYGFNATVGWDATTGLGSVNFEKLAAALMDA